MYKIVVIGKDGKKKFVNVPSWDAGNNTSTPSSYNDVAWSLAPLLYLDAGRTDSYKPSNGPLWLNLSGSAAYNATLTGSGTYASYSTGSGGRLNFASASGQWASVNDLGTLSNFTAIVWANLASLPVPGVDALITNRYVGSGSLNFAIGSLNSGDNQIHAGYYSGSWITSSGYTATTNTWTNYAVTYNSSVLKFFVNGNLYSARSSSAAALSSGLGVNIAKRWDASGATDFITGSIPVAVVYNKALTDSNIFDIYSQFKIRYIF